MSLTTQTIELADRVKLILKVRVHDDIILVFHCVLCYESMRVLQCAGEVRLVDERGRCRVTANNEEAL